jgi:putative transposase
MPSSNRRIEGEWPYLWLDATSLKVRELVISDSHEGLKAAIAQVFTASWQRCRVHFIRNALADVSKTQHSIVAAAIRTVFA